MRELPYSLMIMAGALVSVVLVTHAPGATLEPLAAVIIPAVVSALGRSRPAD